MYVPTYGKSHALVIGINKYKHARPLGYAVNDAQVLATLLKESLGFDEENVKILTDEQATRSAIVQAFLAYSRDGSDPDDRLIVFFAGHGHTEPSINKEVGFLVPFDGDPHDLSTLVRWDELTRDSDFIRAKHILFIMDACYGGLAVTRSFNPGAMRFLSDMMQRISRQVLTAGKANETVADLGGPLPDHSVFTGHLLQALEGKATDNYGNLTANGVIAYVYQAVSADASGNQTPHYGYIHGDGDLIFHPLQIAADDATGGTAEKQLVSIPAITQANQVTEMDNTQQLKQFLSEEKYRIQLHDFVAQRCREVLSKTSSDFFSTQGQVTEDSFKERIQQYEIALQEMIGQEMLMGRWVTQTQFESFRMPIKRLAERLSHVGGSTVLINLRWYPVFLLMYAGGLGAISGSRYDSLFSLLHTGVPVDYGEKRGDALVINVTKPMGAIHDAFRFFPEHQHHYVPRSEYLFKILQPQADDCLFLGEEYESLFDRFELVYALQYLHLSQPTPLKADARIWTPIGRFGWRGKDSEQGPLQKLLIEAKKYGDDWVPLLAGFFGGSLARFEELAVGLQNEIDHLQWF